MGLSGEYMTQWSDYQKKQNERIKWIIRGLDYDKLNDWEQERVEEWEMQSDKGKWLSDRQMEILERIYREKGR